MRIKSLEIQGFKSFPDKTVLNFGQGITAVVGPNGSGKSNISDAVRWVLGEQSTKSLRGAKMEDVVFNGTATRKPQGFAQVTLTVDNSDRRLTFDGDEISVTRRYYRSGESEYMINKAAVRLRDIHELFMDTGLGRDGYSIISQGKIADIVAARSDDRREVFEEAAGISKFRYRKNEAEHRLAQAEENLLRLRDILSELEGRVGPLKEQAEKAEQFLAYSAEKRALEIGLWLYTLEKSGRTLREQEEKILVARSQHEAIDRQAESLQQQVEAVFADANRKSAEIDAVRRSTAEKEEAAVRREGEAAVVENDLRHNRENQNRLAEELAGFDRSAQELEQEIRARREKIEAGKAEIRQKDEQTASLQHQLETLRAGAETVSAQIESMTAEANRLSAALSDATVTEKTAESALREIEERSGTLKDQIDTCEQTLQKLGEEQKETQEYLNGLRERSQELENAARGYEMRLESRRKRVEEYKAQGDRLNLDLGERQRRAKMLEDLERNLEGFAHSVKTVVREAERGNLSGIHGPVSRLLQVPEQYAVAIETGLGSSMQHVVCDTEENAKRAIALLKRQDGGRATFLPLTAIRGNELQEPGLEDCFGFVGIASRLVTCEKKYDGVRRSLLGRIVVAEDLDSAVALAKRFGYRFRVVTLDGQVVNAGGSLTGGSLAKNAGLLNRRNQIKAIRQEAEQLVKKIEALREDYRQASKEASACEADLSGAKAELATVQEDRIRAEAELRGLSQQIQTCKADRSRCETEQRTAGERTAALQKARTEAQAKREGLEAAIAQGEEQLASLLGSRDETAARREQLSEKISQIRLEAVSLERDCSAQADAIAEMENRKTGQAEKRLALQKQQEQYKQEQIQLEEKAAALHREAGSLRQEAAGAGDTIQSLTNERMALEQQTVQLRQQERELSGQRELAGRELARLEEQKAAAQKEYDDIIRRLWDEYELTRKEAAEICPPAEDPAQSQKQLAVLKGKIRGLGSVNVAAVEEYKEVLGRYTFLKDQLDDVEKSKAELTDLIGGLTAQMRELFLARFRQINIHFGETFRELFGGGTASLRLTDPSDVLGCGIEISVQPSGKIITNLDSLSGGEKALASIALYFAIMKVSPTPFCILDEIEAALDDVNVDRFAAYLRRMSESTQFIVITHRRGTMEEADVLYGVTMQEEGVSKLLELHVTEVEEKLGITN